MTFLPGKPEDLFKFVPTAQEEESADKPVDAGAMMDEDMAKAQGQSLDAFVEEVEQNVPATEAEAATTTPVLSLSHEVRHEVAIPDGYPYVPLSQHKYLDPPAKSYPFTLDPFQRLAVGCIERNESVLVSAHTSAGKTVCAEYAIATALRDKQRVIYTSPIKALSNQKYRELQEEFGDVGLMTGDVTINPEASCLVMTTEILRSMLYRGSEVMREVAWVVFDEIHYMRDKERGVVWEETLILLPDAVHYVFLSATIPNALQFARWVSANHRQPCHVVYTNYRPTPLQHYIFPQGGDGLYLVVDEKAVFREENFRKALNLFADQPGGGALEVLGEASRKRRRQNQAKGGPAGPSDLFKIVRMIMTKNYQPCIVFSFSKRECESNAMLVAKLDFNLEEEKRLVAGVFANALESLSEEDRALPQIEGILPLLKRGIGVHHSGLLPILKEVIEILFQEGLIKVLFATETFSIGLNMPARTVVFTSVRKFDGKETRWVSSGEYIQMSGRAGRRGLDSRGIVLLMLEERMEPAVCKRMLKGAADALNSAFHLSYNMILNLMRVEGVSPEYMLERSFFQFQSGDAIPALQAEVEGLVREHDGLRLEGGEAEETAVTQFHELRSQLEALRSDFRAVVHHQAYALPFLQPGRLVRVRDGPSDFGWAVLVALQKRAPRPGKDAALGAGPTHVLDVLLFCRKPDAVPGSATPQPCPAGERGEMLVHPVSLAVLDGISSVRISLPPDLKPYDHRATVFKTVCEVERRFPDGLPLLDPLEDMGIRDPAFRQLVEKIERLETALHAHPLYGSARLPGLYRAFQAKLALAERIAALRRHIRDAQAIVQMDELKARKRVLRRLGFADEHDVILVKGRVACEISTGDELLLTEMVFAGVFNPLSPEQTVALLSCFVFEERADESPKLKEELAGPLRAMQDTARRIAAVSQECRLPLPEAEYLERFRPELMDVVHAWCKGAPFARICRMTDVFEGSIIRCLRRLEELLRQMAQAAKSIGNAELEAKFTEGIARMKRDIVFANSLYL